MWNQVANQALGRHVGRQSWQQCEHRRDFPLPVAVGRGTRGMTRDVMLRHTALPWSLGTGTPPLRRKRCRGLHLCPPFDKAKCWTSAGRWRPERTKWGPGWIKRSTDFWRCSRARRKNPVWTATGLKTGEADSGLTWASAAASHLSVVSRGSVAVPDGSLFPREGRKSFQKPGNLIDRLVVIARVLSTWNP